MKYTTLLIFCILAMRSAFAQQETHKTVKQLENGVVIVESNGVESPDQAAFKSNPVRTVEDWTLVECIDALNHIQQKINAISPELEDYAEIVRIYREEQARIEKRKAILSKS